MLSWLKEQIKNILVSEGSPVLQSIANIVGSFLIWICYILLQAFVDWLENELNISNTLEVLVLEKVLQWGTIFSIVILIGSTIISTIIQLWKTHKGDDDNANGN